MAVTAVEASELRGSDKAGTPGLQTAPSEPEALATTKKASSKGKKQAKKKTPEPVVESYGPFDRVAVKVALDEAAVASQQCATDQDKGEAHLRILLTNRGFVQRVSVMKHDCSPTVAACVVQRFQALRVPPYDGKQRAVVTKVTLL